jgi:hypothetical protein
MNKTAIRRKIERHGFVYTELRSGVRVSARGPKFPADPTADGERPTVVTATRDGEILRRVEKPTQSSGATAYLQFIEEYSTAPR